VTAEPAREIRCVLAIETSHNQGSVALLDGSGTPAEQPFSPGLVHGREIIPRIDELLVATALRRKDIDLVAVSAGPGSYTGIRIGVAAAKALAFGLGIPTLGVSTLEAIARNVLADGPFAVVLDARRERIYGAHFVREDGKLLRESADGLHFPQAFFEALPPGTPLVGVSVEAIPGAARFPRLATEWDMPRAGRVAAIAYDVVRAARAGVRRLPAEFEHPHSLVPVYLRRSEAEEKWER